MKRKTISLLSLFCFLTLLVSLCSCSSGFKGKYRLKMICDSSGKLYELGDTWHGDKLTKDTVVVTINNDHTLIVKIADSGSSNETKGVWYKVDDYTYQCSYAGGGSTSVAVNGNTIIYKNSGIILILEK